MGITRRDEERLQHYAIQEVTDVVGYLRKNSRKNMTTAEGGAVATRATGGAGRGAGAGAGAGAAAACAGA